MFSRYFVAAVLLASSAWCAPQLTTIQDTLYVADGTRFNGTLTIRWRTFDASDTSTIAMQGVTVQVANGALSVQLVPTANSVPAATYTVTYNSAGKYQFQEAWSVPVSTTPLRVRDVRIGTSSTITPATGSNGSAVSGLISGTVEESDVNGLVADLAARPVSGPGLVPGRVAVVNDLGALESADGNPTDCLHVDGSSGPCGSSDGAGVGQVSFVDGEALTGIVDGANRSFTISGSPTPASSVAVYRNGLLQKIGQDYTFSGQTVQFVSAATPRRGDTLLASYRISDNSTQTPLPSPQVLCTGNGGSVTATAFASLGSCVIPASLLATGDRVEVRLDFEHQGSVSGFTFALHWGATTVLQRDGGATDSRIAVSANAGLWASGAQWSFQSWGSALAFSAGLGTASDDYTSGLTIDIQGKVSASGDALVLRSYSVVRVP